LLLILNYWDLLVPDITEDPENISQEITVIFPENKPEPKTREKEMLIVENQNENDEIPEDGNLLSDKNSRARNEQVTNLKRKNTPQSSGNVDHQELSNPKKENKPILPRGYKPFSSAALTGKQVDLFRNKGRGEDPFEKKGFRENSQSGSKGLNQRFNQNKFSVEEVGSMSLSTYAWEWAPYVRKLKEKHSAVWFAPPAYNRLGIIHGTTKIVFEIGREGQLIRAKVIDHKGHESLEVASLASVKAIFPFRPLPKEFPDETLTITATLVYPDLKKLYKNRR